MGISYRDTVDGITASDLQGFFVGWPKPPSPETHLQILKNSSKVWLALEDNHVVGFINAVSDGVLSAFIPLLEVLPEYQHLGIGSELVRRMLESLKTMYSIDLICDSELQSFYEKLGGMRYSGMIWRNRG